LKRYLLIHALEDVLAERISVATALRAVSE
jgi:hypothetical protein